MGTWEGSAGLINDPPYPPQVCEMTEEALRRRCGVMRAAFRRCVMAFADAAAMARHEATVRAAAAAAGVGAGGADAAHAVLDLLRCRRNVAARNNSLPVALARLRAGGGEVGGEAASRLAADAVGLLGEEDGGRRRRRALGDETVRGAGCGARAATRRRVV